MRKLAVAVAALSLVVPLVASFATDASAEDTVPLGIGGSVTVQIGTQPSAPPPAAPPPAAPPPAYAPPPPPPAYAPPPPPPRHHGSGVNVHDGFYFRIGLGVGGFTAKGTVSPDTLGGSYTISGGGAGVDLALGGTLFPGFVIGGELVFQQVSKPNVSLAGATDATAKNDANFGILGPFFDWYPNPRGGFHFGGVIGPAVLSASDSQTGDTLSSSKGAGASLTAGYDFWVSPQWSIGLGARLFGGSVSQSYGDGSTEKNRVSGATLSVSALWH